MSTQTYDETKHPRGAGGRFTTKPASESAVDLTTTPSTPARDPGEYSEAIRELQGLEAAFMGKVAEVRTQMMQAELARRVLRSDAEGEIPQNARYLLLDCDDTEVNDYGSTDYLASGYLDEDRGDIPGLDDGRWDGLRDFGVSMYADGGSPDMYADSLIVPLDEDYEVMAVDLHAVRAWAANTGRADLLGGTQ